MKSFKHTPLALAIAVSMAASVQSTFAQNEVIEEEELITIGTRSSKPRSATDSTVPVDVISGNDFSAMGGTADVTDNLQSLVPSYTATPATGDGSAFVRPTSLRGTAPDQTLVLVNGKRRHRSALVQFFAPAAGNGAHGPDVAMIPSIALKRVEVLRDGAASQYGSDAIAGVINFELKDAPEGGEVMVNYGQHYEGEQNYKVAANVGLPLGPDGFANLSLEYSDNEALSRGVQRPDAQALIDDGVQGVGADSPFDDSPFAQTWGRPETEALRLFYNAGIELGDSVELYSHGNYAETEGIYRFFYRRGQTDNTTAALHGTLATLRDEFGYSGSLLQTGYTPFLTGDQTDASVIVGLKGVLASDLSYDLSVGYGANELEYFLENSTNPALGLNSAGDPLQRNFDVGGFEQEELNINADFALPVSDNISLAFGAEWREETYTVVSGEANSIADPTFAGPSGANGLNGIPNADAGEFDRDNWAIYADVEFDISEDFLVQTAVRYEDFSDFGDTTNAKLAARYTVTDAFKIRGAVSTGFHAPTPGQSNVQTTITTFDGTTGLQVEEGLVRPTSDEAALAGGAPLTEEKSTNLSLGFAWDINDSTTLTADVYQIEVDDRIYRTNDRNINAPVLDANGNPVLDDGGQPVTVAKTISFYTNALDVEHQGLDLVLTSGFDWNDNASTDLSFAFNYNDIEVVGQTAVNGIDPVSDATIEDIENNFPNERFVFTANTSFAEDWNALFRVNYYGEHYDERGTINGEPGSRSTEIDPVFYVDLELGWDVSEELRLTLGGSNIFDEFPEEIADDGEFANRQSVGLQYPRRSAANYEGGSWYLRMNYTF